MAAVTGSLGSVTYAAGYVTNAYKWRGQHRVELHDTTPFAPSDNQRQYTAGLEDWNIEYECYLDGTTALPKAGTTGAATFTAHTGRTWAGTIVVEEAEVDANAAGNSIVRVRARGNGKLTAA